MKLKVSDKIKNISRGAKEKKQNVLSLIKAKNIEEVKKLFLEDSLTLFKGVDEDIIFLCDLLKTDKNLKTLDIEKDLTEKSFEAISEMIKFNRSLTTLNVSYKNSTNEELQFFESSLHKNYYLTSLKLGKSSEDIDSLILRNTVLPKKMTKKWNVLEQEGTSIELKTIDEVINLYQNNAFKFLGVCKNLQINDKDKFNIFIGRLPKFVIKYITSFIKIEEVFEILGHGSKSNVTKSNVEHKVTHNRDDESERSDDDADANQHGFVRIMGDHDLMGLLRAKKSFRFWKSLV